MPGNHGLAGLAAIRAQYPGVAVVVVSANDDPRVVRRALDHGAAGYLPKSTGLDELRDAIRALESRGELRYEQAPPSLLCTGCALRYPVRDDIPVLLLDEARTPSAGEAS